MSTIQEELEYIVKSIVTKPESVTIDSRTAGDILILEISADPEIVGQIIGKEGKIIKSIRNILNISFPNQKYSLDIKN